MIEGYAVRIPRLGRFAIDLRADGIVYPSVRPDPYLREIVADGAKYRGTIKNRESIGLPASSLVARWNEEHPEDQVPDAA